MKKQLGMVRLMASSTPRCCFSVLVPLLVCFLWGTCLNKCIAQEDTCRSLDFKGDMAFDGKRLINHVIRTIEYVQVDFCGSLCYMEHNCVSYNVEISNGSPIARKCELNNSTHKDHPEDLKQLNNYIYRGTENPCGQSPCPNTSICQVGFTNKGYRCLCLAGFSGQLCEDIDECSAAHQCDVSAVCNNTHGSYNCTCKEGYYGDGRTCTAILGYFSWKPGQSCSEINTIEGERAVSAKYWLNKTSVLFQTYCHMESAAQVWTLIARFSEADAANWMEDSGDWWYDNNSTVGETDPSSNTDMISPAFWLINGNEFKITRSDDPQHTALLQTTGDCLDGQTFRSKITSFGDFRNGVTWRDMNNNRCLGNCTVQYGGQYETTKGFIRAKCNGTILSADKIGFWCDRGTWDGSVMMIGGSGTGVCGHTYHGIGVTRAKIPSFLAGSGRHEADFGDNPYTSGITEEYSLNLWII